MSDPRDGLIGRVVRGKTFADLGGLWGTVNEKVSVAHRHGASALTMIDRITKEEPDWRAFEEHCKSLALPHVECRSEDILALGQGTDCEQYDVTHCSGVLYHLPDPLRLFEALRRVTREYAVVGSIVTSTQVIGPEGQLSIPEGACLFIPALGEKERRIVQSYWKTYVADGAVGLTHEIHSWVNTSYVPWWWLPTVTAFKAMAFAGGFEYVDGAYFWNDNAYVQLLRVKR
ncbi:MAG: hypothetical protein PHX83_10025 [Acidobacteriia bacterium]|nr:hypothetical protein [Terriglobia bacterium]